MSTITITDTPTCASGWCKFEIRDNQYADGRSLHPDDFSTVHRGKTKTVAARYGEVTMQTVWLEYDVPSDTPEGPQIHIDGDDDSGTVVHLQLGIDAMEQVALGLLELVKQARS